MWNSYCTASECTSTLPIASSWPRSCGPCKGSCGPRALGLHFCMKYSLHSQMRLAVSAASIVPHQVKQILRRRQIRPHWMFVLDSLLSRAVRAALAVLGPGAEKDIVPLRSEELSKEESQPKQQESPVQQSLLPRDPEQAPQLLMVQLSLLHTETERLRDVLVEKERECQALVQQALQRVNEEAKTCALASEPPGAGAVDQGLVQWLQELNVDSGTIQTLLSHSFTLHALLTCATRDDLIYTRIRRGMVCRIWRAILAQRAGSTVAPPGP